MSTSATMFRGASTIVSPSTKGIKYYHWTFNRRGKLTLHSGGVGSKCTRVHYNQKGEKE